jgi:hypothetical protein
MSFTITTRHATYQLRAGDAKAAIARTLKKMAADSNAALFGAETAQAAFDKMRRASR